MSSPRNADKEALPADPSRAPAPLTHETYTHGHAPATVRQHGLRTAEEAAAFLLPELRPGMRLLDVGCGPGSITRGLAERVAPGDVVGVDLSTETLEAARQEAAARGAPNLRYQEASVYALPFADGSFDVVYAHQVLQHLKQPAVALAEMLRVLVPGGLLAVRDVECVHRGPVRDGRRLPSLGSAPGCLLDLHAGGRPRPQGAALGRTS